jgi:deoxyribodipyrimidine photo-lyase
MDTISIFWFRRDLRLHDNVALYNALQSEEKILPIFIFDINILEKIPKNDARISFIHKELNTMNEHLKSFEAGINMFHGNPKEVFQSLIEKYHIVKVFTNHDYEPYAIKRDLEIKELLASKSIEFHTYKDQVIFERNEIVKKDGTAYKVYTPFSRKWIEAFQFKGLEFFPSEENLENFFTTRSS